MQLTGNDRARMNSTTVVHGCAWGHAEVQANVQLCLSRDDWRITLNHTKSCAGLCLDNLPALTEISRRLKLRFLMSWVSCWNSTLFEITSLIFCPWDPRNLLWTTAIIHRYEYMIWLILHSSDQSSDLSLAKDLFLSNIQNCLKTIPWEESLVLKSLSSWFTFP